MAEQGFTRMVLNYPYPAQAQAYEAVLKERAALRKKFGLGDSVNVAQLVIGADGPAYAVLVSAKDELDFYTQFAKDTQKMGAEWTKSLDQSAPLLRRIEFVTFVARPALMYQP